MDADLQFIHIEKQKGEIKMVGKIGKLAISGIVTSLLVVNIGSMAFAAEPAPDAVITGGALAIAELGIDPFTTVLLDGTTQTTTAVVIDTVLTDSTGTGDGWQVSLYASPFILDETNSILYFTGTPSVASTPAVVGTGTEEAPEFAAVPGTPAVLSPLGTLPSGSLALGAVTIATVDAGSTAIGNIDNISSESNISESKLLDTESVLGINILSAPIDGGMGTYTVSMLPMTLTLLPATTYAGTYTSTVTQTLTSGPAA